MGPAQSAARRARRPLTFRPRGTGLCALRSALGALVLGCSVPAPTAPPVEPELVVFGVLDPTTTEQVILLMRSRESVPDTTPHPIDPNDPVVSAGETPVTGATVVLYGPTGDSALAVEDRTRRSDHLGAGVYRLWGNGSPAFAPQGAYLVVLQGRQYRLRISSSLGDAEATTTVPSASQTVSGALRTVSLARDSVMLSGPTVNGAGFVYTLRAANGTSVEGNPQYRRALERRLMLPTTTEWAFAYAKDRLRAGTRHVLTVAAADSNYLEYYGGDTDPFADRSQRTTLRGAAGVFASAFVFYQQPVVLAP
jgi:Domain of unknown function (DUF4249)